MKVVDVCKYICYHRMQCISPVGFLYTRIVADSIWAIHAEYTCFLHMQLLCVDDIFYPLALGKEVNIEGMGTFWSVSVS